MDGSGKPMEGIGNSFEVIGRINRLLELNQRMQQITAVRMARLKEDERICMELKKRALQQSRNTVMIESLRNSYSVAASLRVTGVYPYLIDCSTGETPAMLIDGHQTFSDNVLLKSLVIHPRPWLVAERSRLKTAVLKSRMMQHYSSVHSIPPTNDVLLMETQDVDWSHVKMLSGLDRTPMEHFIQWMVCQHPLINNRVFDKADLNKLLMAVQTHGRNDWIQVARLIDNGRTAFQCFRAFINLQPRQSISWSASEDAMVRRVMTEYQPHTWKELSTFIDGRTQRQCMMRYRYSLQAGLKKGRWSADETKLLQLAIDEYGTSQWLKVSSMVPCRTAVQCRQHYFHFLQPGIDHSPFTTDELETLRRAVRLHGSKWAVVATCFKNRTRTQCRDEWRKLNAMDTNHRKTSSRSKGKKGSKKKKKH